eukprot:m51a1_g5715 hypothetical protein (309) ;mRNA; r:1093125-1094458
MGHTGAAATLALRHPAYVAGEHVRGTVAVRAASQRVLRASVVLRGCIQTPDPHSFAVGRKRTSAFFTSPETPCYVDTCPSTSSTESAAAGCDVEQTLSFRAGTPGALPVSWASGDGRRRLWYSAQATVLLESGELVATPEVEFAVVATAPDAPKAQSRWTFLRDCGSFAVRVVMGHFEVGATTRVAVDVWNSAPPLKGLRLRLYGRNSGHKHKKVVFATELPGLGCHESTTLYVNVPVPLSAQPSCSVGDLQWRHFLEIKGDAGWRHMSGKAVIPVVLTATSGMPGEALSALASQVGCPRDFRVFCPN